MELKLQKLEQRLVKYHFIAQDNVRIIIEDEFDFIEECLQNTQMSIEDIAKALIDIYMVA
ncbi:hypothetical protein [Sulfurimonas sp. HSL3-2]|jgi:hypothetical protein|uniref:hypothetical protein n=1 Tax=Hydrocurvibacter mobilis TaxID=3131936 RepID=UPI0031F97619